MPNFCGYCTVGVYAPITCSKDIPRDRFDSNADYMGGGGTYPFGLLSLSLV